MNYYLKNFEKDTVEYLGSSDNMYELAKTLISAVKRGSNSPAWWDNGPSTMKELSELYNQTGKDCVFFPVRAGYIFLDGMTFPTYTQEYRLRPWLVIDETGRHVALDEVKSWIANYKPVKSSHYWGCPPDATRGRRWKWPALLANTNRLMNDPDAKAEVEELAGSHLANKLFSHKLEGWNGLFWSTLEGKAYRRRPKKSWKNKKCSRQWQQKKKCGQRPSRPILPEPELDMDESDIW